MVKEEKKYKIIIIIIAMILILLLSFKIPSFARYKNRTFSNTTVWSGNIATKYKSGKGTLEEPYIISNGEELAYFSSQLENNTYKNTYFKITNDIIINDGKFIYEDDKPKYEKDNQKYYIKDNKYYINEDDDIEIGTINIFPDFKNFEGTIDGDYHRIYGYYKEEDKPSLFKNLKGNIENIYIENTFVKGKVPSILSDKIEESNIKNILVNGFVINDNDNEITREKNFELEEITLEPNEIKKISIESINSEAIKTKLYGTYKEIENLKVTIDGEQQFGLIEKEITTNKIILENMSVQEIKVKFENLKYEETFASGETSGLVIESNYSTITNCINKATVIGMKNATAITSYNNNTNIINTYNVGTISSLNNTSLFGVINDSNITITRTYNKGNLLGTNKSIIDKAINSNININNSFILDGNIINTEINSDIVNTNNYVVSNEIIESQLKDKTFMTNYNEFNNFDDLIENEDNVWVFEDDNYPVLYIDDILNENIELYVNTYSWDSYSEYLDTKKINTNITFAVNTKEELDPPKEIYYYINNSQLPLTKQELDNVSWQEYDGIEEITEEGFYTIYIKEVSQSDEINYINSDLLILDKTPSQIDINVNNNHYNTINNDNLYINNKTEVTINATDTLSGIKSIKYYISNEELDEEELDEELLWQDYINPIKIEQIGEYKIYVKVIDNCDFEKIASTPTIELDGYKVVSNELEEIENITDNSKIILETKYENNKTINEPIHNIISNQILPQNTKITLIDYQNNKIYTYKVDNSTNYGYNENNKAVYPFTLMKEIGTSKTKNYIETSISNEHYKIILDFEESNINKNYENIIIGLETKSSNKTVRETLETEKKSFNIYKDNTLKLTHEISTNYNSTIEYNSDSQEQIEIETIINYQNINNKKVYDTNYDNKKIGLIISMKDSNGITLGEEYLKNITFKVGEQTYYPRNDNIVRINFDSNTSANTMLEITTHELTTKLKEGIYYIEIKGYSSLDGIYKDTETQPITIPLIIENTVYKDDYKFDVTITEESRIITKQTEPQELKFNITTQDIENPIIRLSMYKKKNVTAYDQEYTLIDLKNYTNDNLNKYIDKVYNINFEEFTLNLNTDSLDKTGYKFVFDLYDGNKKITSISKNVIIK